MEPFSQDEQPGGSLSAVQCEAKLPAPAKFSGPDRLPKSAELKSAPPCNPHNLSDGVAQDLLKI